MSLSATVPAAVRIADCLSFIDNGKRMRITYPKEKGLFILHYLSMQLLEQSEYSLQNMK